MGLFGNRKASGQRTLRERLLETVNLALDEKYPGTQRTEKFGAGIRSAIDNAPPGVRYQFDFTSSQISRNMEYKEIEKNINAIINIIEGNK